MNNANISALSLSILTAARSGNAGELARTLAGALVVDTRTSGESFTRWSDEVAGEARELADRVSYAAHGDGARLPSDWVDSVLPGVLETLADEGDEFNPDPLVEIRTAALVAWLLEPGAADALDEFVSEAGWPEGGLSFAIMGAQYGELRNIGAAAWAALEEIAAEYGEEEAGTHDGDLIRAQIGALLARGAAPVNIAVSIDRATGQALWGEVTALEAGEMARALVYGFGDEYRAAGEDPTERAASEVAAMLDASEYLATYGTDE